MKCTRFAGCTWRHRKYNLGICGDNKCLLWQLEVIIFATADVVSFVYLFTSSWIQWSLVKLVLPFTILKLNIIILPSLAVAYQFVAKLCNKTSSPLTTISCKGATVDLVKVTPRLINSSCHCLCEFDKPYWKTRLPFLYKFYRDVHETIMTR